MCYSIEETDSLDLSWNQLSGEIPSEIGNLTKLETLSLYNNQLDGEIPLSIGNMNNLSDLSLFNNQLTGHIPESLNRFRRFFYYGAMGALGGVAFALFKFISGAGILENVWDRFWI